MPARPGLNGHPLAPNGKRSNLTEDQWAAVRTGNFNILNFPTIPKGKK